jgi:hypothetical protein
LTVNFLVDVDLSEHTAARLEAAVKHSGTTKSALIEAALDLFLETGDGIEDSASLARQIAALGHQLQHIDRDLAIVNETVALHARFHLALTPPMAAAEQRAACALGSERFEEFATQVGRRVDRAAPLMQTTIDRLGAAKANLSESDLADRNSGHPMSATIEPVICAPAAVDVGSVDTAVVREDGSSHGFQDGTESFR